MENDTDLDWPNLNRYKDENTALNLLEHDKRRVVFMGELNIIEE